MARQHLPRRHGRRLSHRRRHLRLDEHGRRLGHGELDQAREPRSTSADPRRPLAHDGQSADGQKEDRIQLTSAGFVTRHVIHDTVTERQGSREFITIKPYLRIVAGLATDLPEDADTFPPSIPSSSIPTRRRSARAAPRADAPQSVSVNVLDIPGGELPQDRRDRAQADEVSATGRRGRREFRLCRRPTDSRLEARRAHCCRRPIVRTRAFGLRAAPNTTVIHKSAEDAADDDDDDIDDDLLAGTRDQMLTVGRGDTLSSLFAKIGAEPSEARRSSRRFRRLPAPGSEAGQESASRWFPRRQTPATMEPVKISVFAKGDVHLATVARNRQGDFVATAESIGERRKAPQTQARATLYTSFYHAALSSTFPPTPSSNCSASIPTTSTSSRG